MRVTKALWTQLQEKDRDLNENLAKMLQKRVQAKNRQNRKDEKALLAEGKLKYQMDQYYRDGLLEREASEEEEIHFRKHSKINALRTEFIESNRTLGQEQIG